LNGNIDFDWRQKLNDYCVMSNCSISAIFRTTNLKRTVTWCSAHSNLIVMLNRRF